MDKYWILSNINVYGILCPPKLKKYSDQKGKKYAKEDIIYLENNPDHNVYLVSGGKVKLVNYDKDGNEIVRQIITKGGLFGENLLLGELTRNEYAVACDPNTTVCSMNINTMRDLMRDDENFSTAIYKFIGLKIRKIERRLDLLVGKDVRARIASYIFDIYKEEEDLIIKHRLSQKDVASLLGTSRESVAKVFNALKDKRIIDYGRKEIIIIDLKALKEMSRE